MNKHDGHRRQYVLLSEAWYGKSILPNRCIDEVMFGLYAPEGGTSGEMAVRWQWQDGKLVPRLECYDDGWSTLAHCKDVLDALAQVDNQNISPKEFCLLLDECGFVDTTPRTEGKEEQIA